MRKFFSMIALLLMSVISLYGMNHSSDEAEKAIVKIDKTKIKWSTDTERSLDNSIIEAFVYPSSGIIEVSLYNIGYATVRLMSSNNQVIQTEETTTDNPVVVYLNTFSTDRTYYIEISSDSWYAEGIVVF